MHDFASTPDAAAFAAQHADGTAQAVAEEPWGWQAVHDDGTVLCQFDRRDGTFHPFGAIDRARLAVFSLVHRDDASRRFDIPIRPGMRPIHAYRVVVLNAGTARETRIRTYLFGYQETRRGRNVKAVLQVWPEGRVTLMNDDGRGG